MQRKGQGFRREHFLLLRHLIRTKMTEGVKYHLYTKSATGTLV